MEKRHGVRLFTGRPLRESSKLKLGTDATKLDCSKGTSQGARKKRYVWSKFVRAHSDTMLLASRLSVGPYETLGYEAGTESNADVAQAALED